MKPEILSNLWQVGGPGYTFPEDAAIYLIRLGDKAVLIDAGCGSGHDLLKINVEECLPKSVPIEYLLLTHCHFDHTGGAEAVRREYGCKILAHTLDAAFLETGDSEVTAASWYGTHMEPLNVDVKIENDPQAIRVGNGKIVAHHWPGHSPGSVVYTTRMDGQKVLFGQDVHGPLDASLKSDAKAYQMSLQKMLNLNADILCEGHYGVYRGKEAVKNFIGSFMA